MTEGRHAWTPPSTFHSHRVQGPIMSNLRNDTWGIYRLIICSILAKRTALLLRGPVNKILHAKAVYCFSSCFLLKSLVWIPHIIPYQTKHFKTQLHSDIWDPTLTDRCLPQTEGSLVGGPTRVCGFNSFGARTWTEEFDPLGSSKGPCSGCWSYFVLKIHGTSMCEKSKVPSIFCILFLVAQLETLRTTSHCEMRKNSCPISSIKIDLWMFTLQLGQCQHLAMGLSDDMSSTVLFPLVENWVNIIRYVVRPWVFCTKSFLGKDRKFLLTRLKFYLERFDSWWHDIGIHRLHISYMLRHGHVHSLVPAPCHHSWQTLVNWILRGRWTHNRILKKMTRIIKIPMSQEG